MTGKKPKQKEGIIKKSKKEGGGLLFNIEKGELLELNGTGLAVWDLCDGTRTINELEKTLSNEYELSDSDVDSIGVYVKHLSEFGLLE